MNRIGTKASLVFALLLLTACPGTRTGNPDQSSLSVSLAMTGTTSTLVAQHSVFDKVLNFLVPFADAFRLMSLITDRAGHSVNMIDAFAGFAELEFELAGSAEETEVHFPGPYFVDLLATNPEVLGETELPSEGLKKIQMKLHKPEDDAVGYPAELSGKSIYLAGQVDAVAFSYSTAEESEFEMGGDNAIVPANSDSLLAVIKIGELIQSIDLTDLILAGDKDIDDGNRIPVNTVPNPCPAIVVNSPDLFTCFRDGLEVLNEFGKDSDGSGELEDDEDSTDD